MAFTKQTPDTLIAGASTFTAASTTVGTAVVDVTAAIGMLVQFTGTASAAGTIIIGVLTSPDNTTWDSSTYPYCSSALTYASAVPQTFSFAIPFAEGIKYVKSVVVTPTGVSLSATSAVLVRATVS